MSEFFHFTYDYVFEDVVFVEFFMVEVPLAVYEKYYMSILSSVFIRNNKNSQLIINYHFIRCGKSSSRRYVRQCWSIQPTRTISFDIYVWNFAIVNVQSSTVPSLRHYYDVPLYRRIAIRAFFVYWNVCFFHYLTCSRTYRAM